MSRRANFPSTNDIQNQIESSFESAGSDVPPISIGSQSQATNEVEKLVKDFNTPKAEWDFTVKVIERSMGLINGGLFKYLDDPTLKSSFSRICIPLLNASNNLRSALVKQSCLLIAQIAHVLGNKFELFMPIGDDMINTLSSQTSHGTQIIAESCRFAIIHIARSCASKKILRSIVELSKVKSSANRQISAECLCFICGGVISKDIKNPWKETKLVEQNDNIISEALQRLMEDASQNIRKVARMASQIFIENYPQFEEQLLSGTDERSINYINKKSFEKNSSSKKRSKSPYTSYLPVPKNKRKRSSVPRSNTDISDTQNTTSRSAKPNERDNDTNDYQREAKSTSFKPKEKPASKITNDTTNNYSNSIKTSSPKRRSKSSLPARLTTFEPKPNLKYKKGHENEFLEAIEESINTNQQFDLSQSLKSIIPGIFSCCESDDKSIRKRGISIIQNLIHVFPKSFDEHIPQILSFILVPSNTSEDKEQETPEAEDYYKSDEEDIMSFCRDLQATYNPNTLLSGTENIEPSPILLKFVANLCDDFESDLHDKKVCENVYNIAIPYLNEDEDSSRRVMYAIWWQNISFFNQGQNNNQNDQQSSNIDPQVQQMIQDFKEKPGHPRFNPRGVSLWCDEVRQYIATEKFTQKVKDDENCEDVKNLFDEIFHALILTNEKNLVISLMIDVLKSTQNAQFNIFLLDIVRFYRDRKARDITKLLKYMMASIETEDIIKALFDDADSTLETQSSKILQNLMIRNIIEILTEIVKTCDKEKVEQLYDQIVQFLLKFINDKDTHIRRAVIIAFVELSIDFSERTKQVIEEKLNKVQQKLVYFYRDQRE